MDDVAQIPTDALTSTLTKDASLLVLDRVPMRALFDLQRVSLTWRRLAKISRNQRMGLPAGASFEDFQAAMRALSPVFQVAVLYSQNYVWTLKKIREVEALGFNGCLRYILEKHLNIKIADEELYQLSKKLLDGSLSWTLDLPNLFAIIIGLSDGVVPVNRGSPGLPGKLSELCLGFQPCLLEFLLARLITSEDSYDLAPVVSKLTLLSGKHAFRDSIRPLFFKNAFRALSDGLMTAEQVVKILSPYDLMLLLTDEGIQALRSKTVFVGGAAPEETALAFARFAALEQAVAIRAQQDIAECGGVLLKTWYPLGRTRLRQVIQGLQQQQQQRELVVKLPAVPAVNQQPLLQLAAAPVVNEQSACLILQDILNAALKIGSVILITAACAFIGFCIGALMGNIPGGIIGAVVLPGIMSTSFGFSGGLLSSCILFFGSANNRNNNANVVDVPALQV